jgi:hypothetical protein
MFLGPRGYKAGEFLGDTRTRAKRDGGLRGAVEK